MTNVVGFRPFKLPIPSGFLSQTTYDLKGAEAFRNKDLARSGLTVEDARAYENPLYPMPIDAEYGYCIPYCDQNGQVLVDDSGFPLMYRMRLKAKANRECQRYTQPSKEKIGFFATVPYIPPWDGKQYGDELAICEGEKKTLAVRKHLGIQAIGIGGAENWRHNSAPHPWILELAKGKKVYLIPDADVMRYDIARAYGNLAAALQALGCAVEIVVPPDKIDDWIVAGGDRAQFDILPRKDPSELNQSGEGLIAAYNLAFKVSSKGAKTILQHTSNIMKLMEEHPAFPKVWLNLDCMRVYIGDVPAVEGLSEMEVANYFQHNLGFDTVKHITIGYVIGALSKRNARSPFLDWVRGLEWDGTERLSNWLTRMWGAEDNAYVSEVGTKWLVGACARMAKPGTKIDWMPIVVGEQGTGKTSMPGIVFRGENIVVYGDHTDKDFKLLVHSGLCVGFDEMDSFSKKEHSFLKAMITTGYDHLRVPYGRGVERKDRRAVLYACGNVHDFLEEDPSGYRRYCPIEVSQILNFKGLELEVDQLWAEAWMLYELGMVEFWEVDNTGVAEEYVAPNANSEAVAKFLEMRRQAGKETSHFATGDIITAMSLRCSHKALAPILRSMGYEQSNVWIPEAKQPRRVWVKTD